MLEKELDMGRNCPDGIVMPSPLLQKTLVGVRILCRIKNKEKIYTMFMCVERFEAGK
jgi:hypothetical protein